MSSKSSFSSSFDAVDGVSVLEQFLCNIAVPSLSYRLIGGEENGGSFARTRKTKMASYLWRKYADYVYNKWERTLLWDMLEPYRRPKSFTPLVTIYIAAFYTGVVGAAITEQLYKEKYWEDHPGEAVPLMKPKFYGGPWKVLKGDVLPPNE
ncbi:hypothetical protein GQ457_13G029740 [Hibiscus cannabinus]